MWWCQLLMLYVMLVTLEKSLKLVVITINGIIFQTNWMDIIWCFIACLHMGESMLCSMLFDIVPTLSVFGLLCLVTVHSES